MLGEKYMERKINAKKKLTMEEVNFLMHWNEPQMQEILKDLETSRYSIRQYVKDLGWVSCIQE